MKQTFYNQATINTWLHNIIREMAFDNWKPNYIVGLARGGLIPAIFLSHYLDIPMHTLKVSLRDNPDTESNLWMPEEALGVTADLKKILIVDDINDSGETLSWIKEDWRANCLPKCPHWDDVWGNNVRTAVLVNNVVSKSSVDYSGTDINKNEEPQWIIFPWEQWWDNRTQ